MKSVYFIRTADNRPYILVTVNPGSTDFQPLMGDADDMARALDEAYKNKPIKKGELDSALDDDLMIEGPIAVNRQSRVQIASFLNEGNIPDYPAGTKPPVVSGKQFYTSDIADISLVDFSADMRKNAIEYKAMAFIADQTKTTFNYEVKRVRALWDPTLSIPGTNRRGGWRCPVGTRYGGQITDRFGRNCGWGVARRIANAITNIGERMEDVDDRRRGRRVNRRNERMLGRLQRDAGGGRIEQGLRGVADRLDGGEAPQSERRREGGVIDRIFGEEGPLRVGPARINRPQRQERPAQEPRNRPNLRDSERRRMEREINEPGAPRTEEPAPREPREQPRPRRPRGQAVRPAADEPLMRPRPNEPYGDYVNRKWEEYNRMMDALAQQNPFGGRGQPRLTRDEWYKFNRGNLREAWGRFNGGEIPNEGELTPQPERQPRPRAPRRRRVNASDARADEAANRRPRAEDEPVPGKPQARPKRRVGTAERRQQFMQQLQEGFDAQKQAMTAKKPEGATDSEWERYKNYVNGLQIQFSSDGRNDRIPGIKAFERWKADGEDGNVVPPPGVLEPRDLRRNRRRVAPPEPPAPAQQIEGSMPDERSDRNVFNRFRQRGLPDTAYWREPGYQGDDRAELDRRFGRYYDNNNQRNARGDMVNQRIQNGGGRGAEPRRQPPAPPARPARPEPQPAPAAPPAPPQPPAPVPPAPQAAPRPQGARRRRTRQDAGQLVDSNGNVKVGDAGRVAVPFDRVPNKAGTLGIDRRQNLMGEYVPVVNPDITNSSQAIAFVKNGGDLSKVPHEFWKDAIMGNSSRDNNDPNTLYRQIQKNGGAIGDTVIFVKRDANGKPTRQGWVFKAANDNDNMGEVVGWNLQAALGVQEGGAVLDGKNQRGARYVILPFASNDVPLNAEEIPAPNGEDSHRNYQRDLMDQDPESLPGRIVALAINHLLGGSDRHAGNGFGKSFRDPKTGKVVTVNVAWDFGWALQQRSTSIERYIQNYRMDSGLLDKLEATIKGMDVNGRRPLGAVDDWEKRGQIQQKTVAALRDMASRIDVIIDGGEEAFVRSALMNKERNPILEDRAKALYERLKSQRTQLRKLADKVEGWQV